MFGILSLPYEKIPPKRNKVLNGGTWDRGLSNITWVCGWPFHKICSSRSRFLHSEESLREHYFSAVKLADRLWQISRFLLSEHHFHSRAPSYLSRTDFSGCLLRTKRHRDFLSSPRPTAIAEFGNFSNMPFPSSLGCRLGAKEAFIFTNESARNRDRESGKANPGGSPGLLFP